MGSAVGTGIGADVMGGVDGDGSICSLWDRLFSNHPGEALFVSLLCMQLAYAFPASNHHADQKGAQSVLVCEGSLIAKDRVRVCGTATDCRSA